MDQSDGYMCIVIMPQPEANGNRISSYVYGNINKEFWAKHIEEFNLPFVLYNIKTREILISNKYLKLITYLINKKRGDLIKDLWE